MPENKLSVNQNKNNNTTIQQFWKCFTQAFLFSCNNYPKWNTFKNVAFLYSCRDAVNGTLGAGRASVVNRSWNVPLKPAFSTEISFSDIYVLGKILERMVGRTVGDPPAGDAS